MLADLPGLRAEENPPSTMPNEILVTTTRPDIVTIINQSITIVELTIQYNSPECLANAKHRKETKTNYQMALSNLESCGYSAKLITIEIGALGHWLLPTRTSLQELLPNVPRPTITWLLDKCAVRQQPLQVHASSLMLEQMIYGTHLAHSFKSFCCILYAT